MSDDMKEQFGWLAETFGKRRLPLEILQSAAGFYIGTRHDNQPFTRESREYWRSREKAEKALIAPGGWTQKAQL